MFRTMKRKDMQVSEEDIKYILENGEYGIISTIGEDGYPYGIPMSYVYNENIYFHCGKNGHKIDNFNYSNKVSFNIVYDTEIVPENLDHHYKSIIAFGSVVEVDGEEKIQALRDLVSKYAVDFKEKGDISI